MNEKESGENIESAQRHRRRINRMKTAIIVIVIILFILPTLLCIYLGFRVSKLQNQVEILFRVQAETQPELADQGEVSTYDYAANPLGEGYLPDEASVVQNPQIDSLEEGLPGMVPNQTPAASSDIGNTAPELPEQLEGTEPTGKQGGTGDEINTGSTVGVPSIMPQLEGITTDMSGNSDRDSKETDPVEAINDPGVNTGTEPGLHEVDDKSVQDADAAIVSQGANPAASEIKDSTKTDKEPVSAEPASDGKVKITSTGIYAGKKVYLTFDDGPSIYTDEILDILKNYGVKATFFVVGKKDKESKRIYNRIVEEGHTLGMHSYSHIYKQIYNSLEDFDKDFTKLWKLLYDTTGYMPVIYRFPGGSGNMVNKNGMNEFIKYLNEKSILYYDWNVDNGDATGEEFTEKQLMDNVLNGVAQKKRSIVLMHDAQSKRTTVDSLPKLLETLISQGAEVLPLTVDVTTIQQIKAEEVK